MNNDLFVFADVPMRLKIFLEENPNHSIYFNETRNETILQRGFNDWCGW